MKTPLPCGDPAGALPAALLEPSWCSSRTFQGPFISPFGDFLAQQGCALRITITGKDGDDSQRSNSVIQACGSRCHFCYVWIQSVPA